MYIAIFDFSYILILSFLNDEYSDKLRTSRYGINLSKEEADDIDTLITPLIKENEKQRIRRETVIQKGRTYEDFKEYIGKHPECSIVEMDTVECVKGGKICLNNRVRNTFPLSNKQQAATYIIHHLRLLVQIC